MFVIIADGGTPLNTYSTHRLPLLAYSIEKRLGSRKEPDFEGDLSDTKGH